MKERSNKVIEERGWTDTISAMNQVPEMDANMPYAVPRYPSPRRPRFSYQTRPVHGQVPTRSPSPAGRIFSRESSSFRAQQSDVHTSINPIVGRHAVPIVKDAKLVEQEAPKATRPEVRFTLPRVDFTPSIADTARGAEKSSAKPSDSTAKIADEILKANEKLLHLQQKKEAAAKSGDSSAVADITYYAIPDLKVQIEKLQKQQDEEKKKKKQQQQQQQHAAHVSQIKKDRRNSHHTEIETESEYDENDDHDGESNIKDLYG